MNYSELTLRYFETAAGAGVLSGPDVYRGTAGSRGEGTWVQFDVQMGNGTRLVEGTQSGGGMQSGRGMQSTGAFILAARFLAFACPHTIAVCAWIAERAAGPVSRTALPESVQDLSERFAVPAEKRGRLLIIEDAWVAALGAALQRPP